MRRQCLTLDMNIRFLHDHREQLEQQFGADNSKGHQLRTPLNHLAKYQARFLSPCGYGTERGTRNRAQRRPQARGRKKPAVVMSQGSRYVQCPICSHHVPKSTLQMHTASCLQQAPSSTCPRIKMHKRTR